MASINLAPGTQYIIAARKRRRMLYAIAVLVATIFGLGWGGLFLYSQTLSATSANITKQLQDTEQKISALHDDAVRVSLFEKRLVQMRQILDNHIAWSPLFADLERLLPADAVLTSFEVNSEESTIAIQGRASNMDQVAVALASLSRSPGHASVFESGSILGVSRQENGYTFSMTLQYNAATLRSKAS